MRTLDIKYILITVDRWFYLEPLKQHKWQITKENDVTVMLQGYSLHKLQFQ